MLGYGDHCIAMHVILINLKLFIASQSVITIQCKKKPPKKQQQQQQKNMQSAC